MFFNGSDWLLWSLQSEKKKMQQERESLSSVLVCITMNIWFYFKTFLGFSRCLHYCNPWRSALSGRAASGLLSRAEVSAVGWAELPLLHWLHGPDFPGGLWKMNVAQECTLWSDIKFNTSVPGWIPPKTSCVFTWKPSDHLYFDTFSRPWCTISDRGSCSRELQISEHWALHG